MVVAFIMAANDWQLEQLEDGTLLYAALFASLDLFFNSKADTAKFRHWPYSVQTKVLGHLHITATGITWPEKPMKPCHKALSTVFVLMLMPEEVWSYAVTEPAEHWWLLRSICHSTRQPRSVNTCTINCKLIVEYLGGKNCNALACYLNSVSALEWSILSQMFMAMCLIL